MVIATPYIVIIGGYRQVEVPIIPHIKGRDFYPNLAQVSKGIAIAYIRLSIGVTPGGESVLCCGIWCVGSLLKPFTTNDGVYAPSLS